MGRAVLRQACLDPNGSKSSATATLPVEANGALRVWGAFVLLMLLVTTPIFSTVLPPLFDYPNHLARMHLLAEGGNAFYTVQWAPLPNLAQDLIVPPLARIMPLEIASKVFLVATFGLIAGGAVSLNRVATGAWRMWPLLAFLLLYNRTFLWGFLNYLFGLGVALAGTALWFALEHKQVWLRALASTFVALACYLSHIAAFGFYAMVIAGVELSPALTELRSHYWHALGRRITIVGAQFVLPAVLFFAYWRQPAGSPIGYAAWWRKADLLFSAFDNYNRAFDVGCFVLFLVLLGWLAWTQRLRLVPRLGWAVCIVFVIYLLLPSRIHGGSGLDHRLPVAIWLLLVGGTAPCCRGQRTALAIGIMAATLLVIRLAIIEHVWLRADRIYSADLIGIDALPEGARFAVALPKGATHLVPVPEVHLPALAVARRDVFVPTLFAYAGQQPISFNPPFAALAAAATPERLWSALVAGDRAEMALLPVLQQYDFVVMTGDGTVALRPSACFGQFFQQSTFQIVKVLHDPGCADHY
jgi:hypothetical protein